MLPDEQRAGPDATGAAAMPVPAVRARTLGLVWWLAVAIVAADQLTKWLVQSWIPLYGTVSVIPGFVDFVHIHNAGVAFGFLNDLSHPYRSAFTTVLALGALVAIAYYARQVQPDERLARLGLSLVLGGAVGNLIDRLRLGHVIDFIDVYRGDWHFWAFNVADAAITCGAVLILTELFIASRHASHPR